MLNKIITRFLTNKRFLTAYSSAESRTAGIVVIGDEILKGVVTDTNSTFLVKKLYNFGVRVKKVSVISDDIEEIKDEVRNFSGKFTYVITSGGIGPTHDDVTFEGVGKAFDEILVPHPMLVDICRNFFGTDNLNDPSLKLAFIPKNAKLIFSEETDMKASYPLVSIKNVYLFPGIPQLMVKMFNQIGHKVFTSTEKFFTKAVYFNVTEKSLVEVLNVLVKEFPTVIFGSYPEWENTNYKVKITMESTDEEKLKTAYDMMLKLMPEEYIVDR